MKDSTLIAVLTICMFSVLALLAVPDIIFAAKGESKVDPHEYQIELEFDTVLIYQDNRFVGSYVIGDSLTAFEAILAEDNK